MKHQMKPLILLLLISACSLNAPRMTSTEVTSEPSGANVLVVHSEGFYDKVYGYPQKYDYDGRIVSIQGQTPLKLEVPKGSKTQVIVEMGGYTPEEFIVQANMPVGYYDGQNKECLRDKYWSWAWGGFVDKAIRIFRPSIYKEHCTESRYNYHLKLEGY